MLQPGSKNVTTPISEYTYLLIPMPLNIFWRMLWFRCSKRGFALQCMFFNVSKGACSIHSALNILNASEKQQLWDNIDNWSCSLDNHMFDLIKYSSICCKMDCKVLMGGYEVFRPWIMEHTELYVNHYIIIQCPGICIYA